MSLRGGGAPYRWLGGQNVAFGGVWGCNGALWGAGGLSRGVGGEWWGGSVLECLGQGAVVREGAVSQETSGKREGGELWGFQGRGGLCLGSLGGAVALHPQAVPPLSPPTPSSARQGTET